MPVVAAIVLNLLLVVPLAARFGLPLYTWIAAEAVLFAAAFALLPRGRWTAVMAVAAGLVVTVGVVIGLAEAATWRILLRPLNVYLDLPLAVFSHDLLLGSLGAASAVAIEAAGVVAVALVWLLASGVLLAARGRALGPLARAAAGGFLVIAATATGSPAVRTALPAVFAPVATTVAEQLRLARASRVELNRFTNELRHRPGHALPLPGLAGVDVILAFVESYGVSAVEGPRHAPDHTRVVGQSLRRLAAAVEGAGLRMATGRMASPVRGGQSWLAHGTVLSGLWLDSQLRYNLMLGEDAATLIDDFRETGHLSVGVFPAITAPWPDGRRLGYDAVHTARSIRYAGPALNWVTMPDQYTWSWFQEHIRGPAGRPLFAELALISSHAPWTPVLPVLEDWARIGDGAVFHRWADAGPAPAALWRDEAAVRRHFARAVAYALSVASGYAARHVDADTLLILLGDHQPAPLVTGDGAGPDVPVHVISGDPALVQPFLDRGFRPGARLPPPGETHRLSELRGWLHRAFGRSGDEPGPGGNADARP